MKSSSYFMVFHVALVKYANFLLFESFNLTCSYCTGLFQSSAILVDFVLETEI